MRKFVINERTLSTYMKDPSNMYKVFQPDYIHGHEFMSKRYDFDFKLVIIPICKSFTQLDILDEDQ